MDWEGTISSLRELKKELGDCQTHLKDTGEPEVWKRKLENASERLKVLEIVHKRVKNRCNKLYLFMGMNIAQAEKRKVCVCVCVCVCTQYMLMSVLLQVDEFCKLLSEFSKQYSNSYGEVQEKFGKKKLRKVTPNSGTMAMLANAAVMAKKLKEKLKADTSKHSKTKKGLIIGKLLFHSVHNNALLLSPYA